MTLRSICAFACALFCCAILAVEDARADGAEGLKDVMASVVSVMPRVPRSKVNKNEPEGSGVVIFDGHHIITALHVIDYAEDVTVRTFDGQILHASIVGRDKVTDLALLEIGTRLPAISFGDDPDLGSEACAIGNSFGLGLSLTCGLVSATHRTGTGFNPVEDFVQTDAAVNPGSSGGALVNKSGELIGVLSAIFTKSSDANIGVNFAVSTAFAKRVATGLRKAGSIKWNFGGAGLRAYPKRGTEGRLGAQVMQVRPGAAAELAGLKAGDIIRKVGERRIRKPQDFRSAMARLMAGDEVEIGFERNGEKSILMLTAQ